MIDFLNLKQNNNSCECLKLGYSMQLLPNQVDPYVLYIGEQGDYIYIDEINIIDSYGTKHNVTIINGDQEHENYISLKNIQFNDNNKVVLQLVLRNEIDSIKVLYSDPLLISSKNACKTTRINFKCLETDIMQSIQVPIYYVQDKRSTELENYYNIGNKTSISYATSNAKYKVYKSNFISIDAINKLNDALILPFVYFNYKRVTLFEAIEIPDIQADERFGETIINVSEYNGIGNNDITPTLYIGTEFNNDYIVTEDNNYTILE